MSIDGNAYDGHLLKPPLMQAREFTVDKIKKTIVDGATG